MPGWAGAQSSRVRAALTAPPAPAGGPLLAARGGRVALRSPDLPQPHASVGGKRGCFLSSFLVQKRPRGTSRIGVSGSWGRVPIR